MILVLFVRFPFCDFVALYYYTMIYTLEHHAACATAASPRESRARALCAQPQCLRQSASARRHAVGGTRRSPARSSCTGSLVRSRLRDSGFAGILRFFRNELVMRQDSLLVWPGVAFVVGVKAAGELEWRGACASHSVRPSGGVFSFLCFSCSHAAATLSAVVCRKGSRPSFSSSEIFCPSSVSSDHSSVSNWIDLSSV